MNEVNIGENMENQQAAEKEVASETVAETVEAQDSTTENVNESLEAKLEASQAEVADLKDKLLRTVAEQENFKKRMERERLAQLKYEGERIFREVLPSVDNLERAINQGIVDGASSEQNLAALVEGVKMTLKNLLASLAKFEVKPVDSVGQPFDPQHQEALTMEASDTIPANHVAAEFEKGYYYKDRLLRPAKVIVSSGSN